MQGRHRGQRQHQEHFRPASSPGHGRGSGRPPPAPGPEGAAPPRRGRLRPPVPAELPAGLRGRRLPLAQRLRELARRRRHAAPALPHGLGDAGQERRGQRQPHGHPGVPPALREVRRPAGGEQLGGLPAPSELRPSERGSADEPGRQGRRRAGVLLWRSRRCRAVRLQLAACLAEQPLAVATEEPLRRLQLRREPLGRSLLQ
mmetsp:Transcript_5542/g.11283  ORF Transcript_5542/g.11283 Transcript_5542/m.11283 type:complete len:202 (-) Transcript_5542:182-787(-)